MAANSATSPQPRRSTRLSGLASASNHKDSITTALSSLSSNISEPLKEFKFFPKLPGEIRMIIWELSLPQPRVVEIDISPLHDSLVATTNSPLPAHFQVNYEARKVAQKNYPLVFSSILSSPIRFSFERDILYFELEVLFEVFALEMPDKAKEKLRHLMLARDDHFLYQPETIHLVKEFSNLKSIILETTDSMRNPPDRITPTFNERLCYNRQLQAMCKAATLFWMGDLMGNMLWKREMGRVAADYGKQRLPIFERLRKDASDSRLKSLDV